METSDFDEPFKIMRCLYYTLRNFFVLTLGLIPMFPFVLITSGFNFNLMNNEGFYKIIPLMINQSNNCAPFIMLFYILAFDSKTS
jgi:hypothetical protein